LASTDNDRTLETVLDGLEHRERSSRFLKPGKLLSSIGPDTSMEPEAMQAIEALVREPSRQRQSTKKRRLAEPVIATSAQGEV